MATKITTSRQFRKGRVLHGPGQDFVLVDSPAPKQWIGFNVPHTGDFARVRSFSSDDLRSRYTEWTTGGLITPLTTTRATELIAMLEKTYGVTVPFAAKRVLTRRELYSSYSPLAATGSPAAPMFTSTFDEPNLEPVSIVPSPDKKKGTTRSRSSAFSIPTLPADAYWYESKSDHKLLRDYISLRKAGFTVNLMIAGPSGSGKTVGIEKLGAELGIPVHIVNCQAITTPEKWIGQMMADTDKGTYFVPSQHIQWVEGTAPECEGHESCILLYDEITRLRPELNNMTYSLFDTQRGLEVPQMGRRVHMNPKNLIIATANIGAAFSGTFGQDRAFRERFAMTLERDFPPPAEEIKIITSAAPGISHEDATLLTKVAEASRNLWREQAIEQPISTRTLNIWALLVAGGYDVMQAAEYTVLPLYSEDGGVESDRAKVRLQIEGKVA